MLIGSALTVFVFFYLGGVTIVHDLNMVDLSMHWIISPHEMDCLVLILQNWY